MTRQLFLLATILCLLLKPIYSTCQLIPVVSEDLFVSIEKTNGENVKNRKYSDNIKFLESIIDSEEYTELNCYDRAMAYHMLGLSYYYIANYKKVFELYSNVAIPLWETCENYDEVRQANTNFTAAMAAQSLERFDEGLPYLNKSLRLYDSNPDYPVYKLGVKYRGAGVFHSKAGDYELAEVLYLKAISLFKQANSKFEISDIYNDLGLLYEELQNYQQSIIYLKKSFDTDERLQVRSAFNLADIYLEYLNDIEKSSKYGQIAYDKAIETGDYGFIVNANNIKGRIEYKKENYEQSIQFYNQGLQLCDSIIQNNPNIRVRANLHLHKAESLLELDKLSASNIELEKAISLIVPNQSNTETALKINDAIIRHKNDLIELLSFKADLILNKNTTITSDQDIDSGLGLYLKIDSLFQLSLSDISLNNSQIQASGRMTEYYEKAISRHLKQFKRTNDIQYFHSAYYFSSQLKALILRNTLRENKKLNDEDEKQLRDMNSHLSSLLVDYSQLGDQKDSISTEIIKTQRDIYEFEEKIELTYSNGLNVFAENNMKSVETIQSRLQTDALVVEYFVGAENLYAFAISKTQVEFAEIELTNQTIELISNFIQSCQDPQKQSITDVRRDSKALYDLLLSPLLTDLHNQYAQLIIIPDGLLHALPYDALSIDQSKYLLQEYNVVYTYSHNLYFEVGTNQKAESYVGFGPQYSAELSHKLRELNLLDSTERLSDLNMGVNEIKESASYYSRQSVYTEGQATKSNFMAIADAFDILHLSMHGLVDYQVPDNSSLIFYDGDDDFVLKSTDITALDLESDLVILSSCHSAAGAITKGEGVQGLSRAFILAGSSSVMSSLWNASEYSSSEILPSFFQKFTSGTSKSISLRESKIEYLANARPSLQHPFYWANYILLTHNEHTGQAKSSMIFILLASLFLLALVWFFTRRSK